MNPDLGRLYPYPFERLRQLFATVTPPSGLRPISLSIGEPKHPTPEVVLAAIRDNLAGLSSYPSTQGVPALREAIASWLARRYGIAAPDPERAVLPVTGTREALFAFAQTVVDRTRRARVALPNPFYQIYEGAALLAGAAPLYVPTEADGRMAFEAVPDSDWAHVQLTYVCSPGNPTGRVMRLEEWRRLFELSERFGFVIAADECYSEIYWGETPPLGALQAATLLGRGCERLVVFSSLSKRSNVPGLRSGFAAGDASLIEQYHLYRTYHGCAMSPVAQAASIAAWRDEAHVTENRAQYERKFTAITPLVQSVLETATPEAAFYLWARTPGSDEAFARALYAERHVAVLPGSYLGRSVNGVNPGAGFVRMALVAAYDECLEAARRVTEFAADYARSHTSATA